MTQNHEELSAEWELCPEPHKCDECGSLLVQSKERNPEGKPLRYHCVYFGRMTTNFWDYWGRTLEEVEVASKQQNM